MLKNTTFAYGTIAKFFHWVMAVIFIGMFIVAYIMINIPKSDFRMSLYNLHKATGVLLFVLFALRLSWRMRNLQPKLQGLVPQWQLMMAHANIIFLYILMFAMPLSGFLTSTLGGHDISFYSLFIFPPLAHNSSASAFFADAHEILSYALIASFSLHVLGAAYHHLVLRDEVFKRIWISQPR